jgi:hypothetical protein
LVGHCPSRALPSTGADPAGTVYAEGTGAIPAAFLKGLLCDCLLERVLLAPNGAVLNLGRAVRTATAAQRRALAPRDQGCVWPGCTIPARWSDVHHTPAWIHGGRTDIAALALLCGGHHAQVEHGHYEITMVDGIPHVTPPAWIDPQRRPVRNTYWLDQQAAKNTGRQLAFDVGITPQARGTPGPCPARPQTHPPPGTG